MRCRDERTARRLRAVGRRGFRAHRLGLFAGAAGIAAATGSGDTPAPVPPAVVAPTNEGNVDTPEADETREADAATEANDDGGANCEDGIDAATGAECDGGPAANQDNDANETAGTEEVDD